MDKQKRRGLFENLNVILSLCLLIILVYIYLNGSKQDVTKQDIVSIGASNNASGIVLTYMENENKDFIMEPYFIQDC